MPVTAHLCKKTFKTNLNKGYVLSFSVEFIVLVVLKNVRISSEMVDAHCTRENGTQCSVEKT